MSYEALGNVHMTCLNLNNHYVLYRKVMLKELKSVEVFGIFFK